MRQEICDFRSRTYAQQTKATYEEIKAYVLEQTGLQVSNLYIAQVKRECGIIERENYNKSRADEAKQPQCPDEKKKAIKEALEHFSMIYDGNNS